VLDLGLVFGLGLVMTVQILTVQNKTGYNNRPALCDLNVTDCGLLCNGVCLYMKFWGRCSASEFRSQCCAPEFQGHT